MRSFIAALLGLVLTFCLIGQRSLAQGDSAAVLTPPELIHVVQPIYPLNAGFNGDEAWLELSLRVKADGTPADIKIVDGFYSEPFKVAMLNAISKWRFKPASSNGVPVDWDEFRFSFAFYFTSVPGGGYPAFVRKYRNVTKLIDNKKYAAAKEMIDDMFARHTVRLLYEYAFTEMALYRAELGLGHRQAARKAIYHATQQVEFREREDQVPELGTKIPTRVQLLKSSFLPEDALKQALHFRFYIDNQLSLIVDALETFEKLNALEKLPPGDAFAQQANAIKAALASPAPIALPAKIEDGEWSFRPARRTFTLINLKGRITTLSVGCERHSATLPFQPDVEWTLPATWGNCLITLAGTEGTEFTLVEFKEPQEQGLNRTQAPARAFAPGEAQSKGLDPARVPTSADEPIWPAPPR